MLIRRIAVSACALALVLPAAAGARPSVDPPLAHAQHTVYGDTKYDLQNQQDLNASTAITGSRGDTKDDLPNGTPTATPAPANAPATPNDDGVNGWRIAAVVEAALLAAFAVAAGLAIMRPRRRAPGLGV